MSSTGFHEAREDLTDETADLHRAIRSLIEELEAVDWYRQRADATKDGHLRAILEHNMNEEIEHACMTLEWIRRNVPKFDEELRTYLFTSGDVTKVEEGANGGGEPKRARVTPPSVGALNEVD
jgi:ferritin-like protein